MMSGLRRNHSLSNHHNPFQRTYPHQEKLKLILCGFRACIILLAGMMKLRHHAATILSHIFKAMHTDTLLQSSTTSKQSQSD